MPRKFPRSPRAEIRNHPPCTSGATLVAKNLQEILRKRGSRSGGAAEGEILCGEKRDCHSQIARPLDNLPSSHEASVLGESCFLRREDIRPGSRDARRSLSDALPDRPARARGIRRLPRRVHRLTRPGDGARRRTTSTGRSARRRPDETGRTARDHVAARRSQGHRARIPGDPPRRPGPDSAGEPERTRAPRPVPSIDRSRDPRSQRQADAVDRNPSRAAPERLRNRLPPSCASTRRRARVRDDERPRPPGRTRRLCTGSAQSRRATAGQRHRNRTGVPAAPSPLRTRRGRLRRWAQRRPALAARVPPACSRRRARPRCRRRARRHPRPRIRPVAPRPSRSSR